MKSILFTLTIFLAIAAKKCSKSKEASIPSCIEQHIEAIKMEEPWNPPAEINEYVYEGKRVFLFSSPCCDQYNILVDENCNTICAPTGGYTGRGDGKCPDFKDKAEFVKLVWKDERGSKKSNP